MYHIIFHLDQMEELRMSHINDICLPNNFIQCTYNVQREVDSGLFWFSIVLPNQINFTFNQTCKSDVAH